MRYMTALVGNSTIKDKLCRDIEAERLAHAFIIEGPRGTGKHTLALNIAAALACSGSREHGSLPCYGCPECKKIFSGICPDIQTVGCEGKATLGVDSVRFLRTDVHTVPNDLEFKLYIIEDADKMTVQAQNAFLLTLEEPPKFVHFVLLCESATSLLETVRSRAPVLRTQPITHNELDEYISANDRRAAQMKLTAPAEYAELIMASRHGIGTALEYLEPKGFAPVRATRALACEFCELAVSSAGARAALPLLKKFSQKREALAAELSAISEALTDLLILKKSDSAPLEFFADRNYAAELCDKASLRFLYNLSSAVTDAQKANGRNANVRILLVKLLSDAKIL